MLNIAANGLQIVERHDADMHSPMREGKRMEIGKELASKKWKAACLSVDSFVIAGKPETVKGLCSW